MACKRRECHKEATHIVRTYENLKGRTVGAYCKKHALEKIGALLDDYGLVSLRRREAHDDAK